MPQETDPAFLHKMEKISLQILYETALIYAILLLKEGRTGRRDVKAPIFEGIDY
jgi:hypothetical protein